MELKYEKKSSNPLKCLFPNHNVSYCSALSSNIGLWIGKPNFSAFRIKSGGIFKGTSENSDTVSKEDVDFLVQKERDFSEYYTRRFVDYMCFNNNLFPEYTNNSGADVDPDKNTNPSGWVL